MRFCIEEVPEVWVCEACLLSARGIQSPKYGLVEEFLDSSDIIHHDVLHSGIPRKAFVDSRFHVLSKKLKAVETGKVKFLPAEEVLRLSSGSQQKESPLRNNFRSKFGLSDTTLSRCRGSLIPSRKTQTVAQVISCQREKADSSVISSGFVNSSSHDGAQINTMMNHHAAKMSGASKGKTSRVVAKLENFAVEERDLWNMLPKYEMYRRYLPALEVTWKGGFKFDTATSGKFYGGFQAQPPLRVHLKAIELAQKLPQILQVKMLPRCHLWADLFADDFPDICDIALYFFPAANIERSKQNNFCLFELLEINNLLMRSYIDGLELLIFTSKQLCVDSQRIIARTNTDCFLWGIFRNVKADQILHRVHEGRPSLLSRTECACNDHGNMDTIRAVDMDIDMEGGRIVGSVDMVVSKNLSGSTCGINGTEDVDSATEKILLEHRQICNYSDSSSKFAENIQGKIAFEHPLESFQRKLQNTRDNMVVPPGFKEISRLNFRTKEETSVDDGLINQIKESIGFKRISNAFEHPLDISQGKLPSARDEIDAPPGFKEICRLNSRSREEKPVDDGVINQMKNSMDIRGITGAFEHPVESFQGKLPSSRDEIGVPPGFKEISRLNSRTKEEKPVDGGDMYQMEESICIKRVPRGEFGACSPQPQRSSEDTHLTVSRKRHQEPERNRADEPLAAYPSGFKIKVEGNSYQNLVRTREKESEVMPSLDEHKNWFVGGHARDRNRHSEPNLVEVKPENKMDVSVRWSPPPKGWVKLNIEGSSRGNLGSAGAGGIVRNESGKWLLGYTENLGSSNRLAADLRALYRGLKLVWERGFKKVMVESVSAEAVKCLGQTPAFLDPNRVLIDCCRDLLNRNWECKVKYIHTQGNLCANWLATHVEKKPLGTLAIFDKPPYKLIPILQNECTGLTHNHAC